LTTNGPSSPLTGPNLRTLHRDLAAAQDDQIHRVLTIIDDLAERGDADKLIAPLRGRIAELRPRRKLSLARLLFTPFNPLIVDAASWSAAAPSIPRTAILPLAGQVRDGLGAAAAQMDAMAALHSSTDGIGELVEIGGKLWPTAAKILADVPMPANWTAKPVCENAITRRWPVLYPACLPRHSPYCVLSPARWPAPPLSLRNCMPSWKRWHLPAPRRLR
jgi:hypothetical protein